MSMKAVYERLSADHRFAAALGTVLLALSLAGAVYAVGASIAGALSWRAHYGAPKASPEEIAALCGKAFLFYPHNWYFSITAAEATYYGAAEVEGAARAERLRLAQVWCDRGLAQNPYKSQLRRLKTRLLWEESPTRAIAYWEAYTDWHYWEPYNHATLAELYARAGRFDQAERVLVRIAGRPFYAEGRKAVDKERRDWDDALNGRVGEWGE